jgi:hypothetical protein
VLPRPFCVSLRRFGERISLSCGPASDRAVPHMQWPGLRQMTWLHFVLFVARPGPVRKADAGEGLPTAEQLKHPHPQRGCHADAKVSVAQHCRLPSSSPPGNPCSIYALLWRVIGSRPTTIHSTCKLALRGWSWTCLGPDTPVHLVHVPQLRGAPLQR